MEGRAIARPNRRPRGHRRGRPASFNGGPGNCPAKHGRHRIVPGGEPAASMEGRAIARPNRPMRRIEREELHTASMEGRAIARPNEVWRVPVSAALRAASMEGRAIARPNPGGPRFGEVVCGLASMEGRAIARPNALAIVATLANAPQLQWRAGQLPGQTLEPDDLIGGVRRASMEGRAIARPNIDRGSLLAAHDVASMEGRAIARPNPPSSRSASTPHFALQWRAGQLPGQTSTRRTRRRSRRWRFNGGPGNCPAKQYEKVTALHAERASMEGRAIARPNGGRTTPALPVENVLQWRAGQLPGQTA